jgi:ribosomal protein RSM22 (predicted rRNA methylase)
VLNELPPDLALAVTTRALAALRDHGAVIIIEPALQATARALHALRDALVAAGAHAYAPCPHDAPCPLPERDWCHEERPVVLPPRTRQLAAATGLRDGAMKFSYQVLRREPGTVAPNALRVVGNPHAQKGKLEVPTCSAAGYATLRLLTRHKSDANRALLRAELGDLLQLDPPSTDVTAVTAVTVLRPADGR